jgi:CO/xanthine dehydrogenase Mo-binding subunit
VGRRIERIEGIEGIALSAPAERIVGTPQVRVDAWGKVSGETRYVDDLRVPGLWLGGTVRSPVARGRIRAIHRDPAFDWARVAWVTAADLPGPNVVAMITEDHPILASGVVDFVAQAIALIAAPDRVTLKAALAAVRIEVEELPAVLTVEDALRGDIAIRGVHGADNILAEHAILHGDVDAALARADRIITGTYRTGHQEHLYLEPNGIIAIPHEGGALEIVGSLQCPYYIHAALERALGLPADKIVVRQAPTGGAFGGKEDYPSVLSLHAALLARAGGHPVKFVYDRTEDIRSTTKRHPSIVRHRTGVLRDGTLVAAEIDVVLDGGAYVTLSPVVLSRSILHAAGVYRWPAARIRGRAVATNTPPNGAFRGFGAPQSLFAIERHMDRIALELGIEPLELRRRNLLRGGDRLPFGQELADHEIGAHLVLERVLALSQYEHQRAQRPQRSPGNRGDELAAADEPLRGVGLALYLHGGGFTGAGEERIMGRARVRFVPDPDGSGGVVEVLVSNVEMGQGASTTLAMIAAEALGLPLECVRHPNPDTRDVPDSGPTVASRTTMIVGRIVIDACAQMVRELTGALGRREGAQPGCVEPRDGRLVVTKGAAPRDLGDFMSCAAWYARDVGELAGEATYEPPPGLAWDDEHYQGTAYKAYSWGADVAEVEIDPVTWSVTPMRITSVVEIGRAIHPVAAIGQVEGGQLQALGWGIMEEIKTEGGRFLNDRMATYIIPTSLDAPAIEVEIAELPYARGPYGAKGLGELPMDGCAAAIAAAIQHATGRFHDRIPITPERIFALARTRSADPSARDASAQDAAGGAP